MKYARIYTDASGESHFSDETIALSRTDIAPPAEPADVAAPIPAKHVSFIVLPPGWNGQQHPAPGRIFWFLLGGSLRVTTSDGEARTFHAGDFILAEDTTGKGHTTEVVSAEDVVMTFVEKAD